MTQRYTNISLNEEKADSLEAVANHLPEVDDYDEAIHELCKFYARRRDDLVVCLSGSIQQKGEIEA